MAMCYYGSFQTSPRTQKPVSNKSSFLALPKQPKEKKKKIQVDRPIFVS